MQNVTWSLKEGCGIVFWRLEERFGRLVLVYSWKLKCSV